MVVHTRDQEFYNRFVNPASSAHAVERQLSSQKMIETGKDYPMRYVLYDNNTFYYQIDRLGNGVGTWKYINGALQLKAARPLFDINLYMSAAKAQGDELLFRFIDRFGFNNVPAEFRDPASAQGPLEKFVPSAKDI